MRNIQIRFPSKAILVKDGFTLIEVMVAMCLTTLILVGIYGTQGQSFQIVRSAHDSSSASQVLQQRVEQMRMTPFATIATASGIVGIMNGTAGTTRSEAEMTGTRNFREKVTISNYARPGVTPAPGTSSFTVTRSNNAATSTGAADLRTESQLRARLLVTWDDRIGSHRREFSTILSNGGVSSEGISKEAVTASAPLGLSGTPTASATPIPTGATTPAPAPSAPSATPTPTVCHHGRPWPHCGIP